MKWYSVTFGCEKLAEKCEKELSQKVDVRTVCEPKDYLEPKGLWVVHYMPIGKKAFDGAREIVDRYIYKDMFGENGPHFAHLVMKF